MWQTAQLKVATAAAVAAEAEALGMPNLVLASSEVAPVALALMP